MALEANLPHETKENGVNLVKSIAGGVRTGGIKTTEEVINALKPLGTQIGPFGAASAELADEIKNLRIECARKHIEFPL